MIALKRLTQAMSAAIALAAATLTNTSAHAGWNIGPGGFWGVGPNNNGWSVGPFSTFVFGMSPDQSMGWRTRPELGINAPQNIGVGEQRWFWGVNPHQNIGISAFRGLWGVGPWGDPTVLGMGPQPSFGPWGHWLGAPYPQQAFNPYANPYYYSAYAQPGMGLPPFNPFMGMNPQTTPTQMPQAQTQQQAGFQPVHCTINTVAALTKSVNDCEKAGGETIKKSVATAKK